MKQAQLIPSKIYSRADLKHQIKIWKFLGKKIVFTNGVFDILHEGHIASLSQAATSGDILVVGVNADDSVKRLKGPSRPVNNEQSRALILASMAITDAITLFDEDTPLELIKAILPDVLVKGADYKVENIAGAAEVIANGGEVKLVDLIEGISTTAIINKISELSSGSSKT
jgi:D-beta-D-heptose 7-phosphate kinase/D-beta-D-heptose 1-phosphate adenosyltransferase